MTRLHVLQALAEYDARGGEQFLEVYGFEPSRVYTIEHEGHSYDLTAILGVAHRFATGRLATSEEFSSGVQGAVAILRKRGFEVSEPPSAVRALQPRQARTARTPAARTSATRSASTRASAARSTAAREAAIAICPTCSMTLPATGVCDDCG